MVHSANEKVSGLERIVFMSDAVFAIALTLLVLEIKLPPGHPLSASEFAGAILGLLPKFYSYVLSFLVLAVYWMAHHQTFSHIVRYNARLMWFNLFMLLFVAFLPFSSGLLGEYGDYQLSWVIFALNYIAISILLSLVWLYAQQRGMVEGLGAAQVRYRNYRGLIVQLIFVLSIGISFFNVVIAELTPLLLVFTGWLASQLSGAHPEAHA